MAVATGLTIKIAGVHQIFIFIDKSEFNELTRQTLTTHRKNVYEELMFLLFRGQSLDSVE